MHNSVIAFFRKHAKPEEFAGKIVLEVGSFNVNGGLRDEIAQHVPMSYLGTDMRPGRGVDAVIPASNIAAVWGPAYFNAVICTEMLEHCEDWRGAIASIKDTMAPGGVLYLTARGPGYPLHGYPDDFWRFTPDNMRAMFADFEILVCEPDPEAPGVFLKARRPPAPTKAPDLGRIVVAKVPKPEVTIGRR